jgi:IS1 family transposase
MTVVDRSTSCILGWAVDQERSEETLQKMVDHAPQAAFYFSDLFATYRQVVYYPGRYTPMPDKSETYRVEGDNAELRHYLARLARKSRCFSRCVGTDDSCIKLVILIILLMSWSSYDCEFPHSPTYSYWRITELRSMIYAQKKHVVKVVEYEVVSVTNR